MVKYCPKKSSCEKCKKSHPTVFHKERNYKSSEETTSQSVLHESGLKDTKENTPSTSVKVLAASQAPAEERILCPAVPVEVRISGGN